MHNCQRLMRRMMNLAGGFVAASGDYSTGAAQAIMPYVIGTLEVYEPQSVYPVVMANTELLVFWGADPMLTNQIGSTFADHGGFGGLKELKSPARR